MKVLLATDGSAHADAALDVVLYRPWPSGTEIKVISVVEPLNSKLQNVFGQFGKKSGEAQRRFKEQTESILSNYAAKLEGKFSNTGQVSHELLEGDTRKTIIAAATKFKADLIVVGAHGLMHDEEFGIGSVAEYILHHAGGSVEIIRPVNLQTLVTEIERKHPIEEDKYLLCLDDSDHSVAALEAVLGRTWPKESYFKIITVVEPLEFAAHAIGPWQSALKEAELSEDVDEARFNEAAEMLEAATKRFQDAIPDAHVTAEVLSGEIRKKILEVSKDWPADMIILGSHGQRGFVDSMLGSVSQRVAAQARCSVLVIKPPATVSPQEKKMSAEAGQKR